MVDPKNIKRKHKNILEDDLVQKPHKVNTNQNKRIAENNSAIPSQVGTPSGEIKQNQSKNKQSQNNNKQTPVNDKFFNQKQPNAPMKEQEIPRKKSVTSSSPVSHHEKKKVTGNKQASNQIEKKQSVQKSQPINRRKSKNSNGHDVTQNGRVNEKQQRKTALPLLRKNKKINKKNVNEATEKEQTAAVRQRRKGYGNKSGQSQGDTAQSKAGINKDDIHLWGKSNVVSKKWRTFLMLLVVIVIFVVFYFTGIFSKVFTPGDNPIDSIKYTFMPGRGFPVSFQVPAYKQAVDLGDNAIALVGAQDMEILSKNGRELQKMQHGYVSPGIVAGSTRVVLYSHNGTKLEVFNRSEGIGEIDIKQSIKRVQMNKNNWITTITESDVRIYKPSLSEEWRWKIADENPISAVLNDENKMIAIGSLKASNGVLGSSVELFQINKTDSIGKITAEDAVLIKMEFLSNGKLMIFYDTYTAVYSSKGEELYRFDYNNKQLMMSEVKGQKTVLLFGDNLQENTTVFILDSQLGILGQADITSSVQGIAVVGSTNYILGDSTVYVYNDKGELKETRSSNDRIKTMLSCGSKVFLISADKIYEVTGGKELITSSG